MHDIHTWLRTLHIAIGAVALVLFWLPALTKKGSANHVRFGRWYARAMYAVSLTAITLSVLVMIDPLGIRYPDGLPEGRDAEAAARGNVLGAWFLFMLGLLVISNVRHGRRVLAAREHREQLRTPFHLALIASPGLLGLWVFGVGFVYENLLLQIFSVIAIVASAGMLRYTLRREVAKREWLIQHFGSLIGSGIGAYTAFFAFGGSRLFAEFLSGNLKVIPWILPAVVGLIVESRLARRYRQRSQPATDAA